MSHVDRFTGRAEAYERSRPAYPMETIDAILEGLGAESALAVADVGAGTGISSRLIASRGARVFAIEPNAAMRAAALAHDHVEWIDATAEHTTLADRSVHAVTAFQAWHWTDRPRAEAEARRIVRPGGVLAVVYNERDETDAVTRAFGEIVRRYALDDTEARRTDALARALAIDAGRTVTHRCLQSHVLDRAGIHARAAGSSYLPQTGTSAEAMHAEIDRLFDERSVDESLRLALVTTLARITLGRG